MPASRPTWRSDFAGATVFACVATRGTGFETGAGATVSGVDWLGGRMNGAGGAETRSGAVAAAGAGMSRAAGAGLIAGAATTTPALARTPRARMPTSNGRAQMDIGRADGCIDRSSRLTGGGPW